MGTLPDTTTYADSAGDPSAQPAPRAGASVTYVVLDPALAGSNRPRFDTLFSQFKSGYQHAFHGDEAESTDAWLARIMGKDQPQPVMRIVVAVEQDGERVVGGLAVEFYRAAGCALATYHLYILDEPHLRHHGHARRLLETARGAFGGVGTPHLLLAEAEWPEDLSAQGAPASEINAARERLRFFARIGARLINIDYVQPALGPGQKPVSHLRLLAIPPVATPQAGFEDAS
ncbi:MAG: hypothetical protein ABI580_07795, partial [Burkholderiaceae bacterium]